MTDNIIAIYHPTNPVWPATLRIRLVAWRPDPVKNSRWAWMADGASNDSKDATINAAAMAPQQTYATQYTAITAAKRKGWEVILPDTPEANAARLFASNGGKARTPAKSSAARKNVAAARAAIDPEKQAKAVAESNRRRAKK